MSWRDDPIIETAPPAAAPRRTRPAWQDDPLVDANAAGAAAARWQDDPLIETPGPRSPASTAERAQAAIAGTNRGIAGVLGLPVDTVLNVADLGKAALGVGYRELTGRSIPAALEVDSDRSGFVGSADWFTRRAEDANRAVGVDVLPVAPARPDDTASRYLYAAGTAAPSVALARPSSGVDALRAAAATLPAATATQAATEAFPENRPAQVLAGLLAQGAPTAAAGAVRGTVRGGEAGRQRVAEALVDFERAGAGTPTVGQATQRPIVQAVETLAGRTPGGYGRMRDFAEAQQAGVRDRVSQLVDALGGNRDLGAAGQALQQGARDFRGRFQERFRELDDAALAMIPDGQRFPIPQTMRRIEAANAPAPGMAATSDLIAPGFTQRLAEALRSDAAPTPARTLPSAIVGPDGAPLGGTQVPGSPGGVPFRDFRAVRADVGERAFPSNPLQVDQDTGRLRSVWGGMADDLQAMARTVGPDAARAVDRANRYYGAGSARLAKLEPFNAKDVPEAAFKLLERQTAENVSQVRAVKRSLKPGQWQQQVSVITDRLGRARPGVQDETGDVFSFETFLTNWNRLDPKARSELYSGYPAARDVRSGLDAIAKVAANLREGSQVLRNPSGTGPYITAGNALFGGAAAGVAGGPALAAAALSPVALANVTARVATSPTFVRWLSRVSEVPPERARLYVGQLTLEANRERDPELRGELQAYAGALREQLGMPLAGPDRG